jgi:hypothetical protein
MQSTIESQLKQIQTQLTSIPSDAERADSGSASAHSDVLTGIRSALFCLETAHS